MVSIAIAETSSPILNNQSNETISLRDSALWFPYIPKSDLQLSKTNFRGLDNASSGFRPLCCLLGDLANPAVLSKVLVTLEDNQIEEIHCHYASGDIRRLSSSHYCNATTESLRYLVKRGAARKTLGYHVKRIAGEHKDTISFVHNGEWRPPKVSNFSKCLVSYDSKNRMLRSYRLL
jgi:hypothetical protein